MNDVMDNDKEILTDDQLKGISGGSQCLPMTQNPCKNRNPLECIAKNVQHLCVWENGRCVRRTT